MNGARVDLRKSIAAVLAAACLALGASHPGWSFALYQLGYYGSAERAATLAVAWRDTGRRLGEVQSYCGETDVFLCNLTVIPAHLHAADMAQGYLALAGDPADPDFTAVDVPAIERSEVPRWWGIPATFIASWNSLFANYARTAAVLEAFVTSNQRAQGAALAGDDGWKKTQSHLAALYADELSRLTADQPALAANAVASWYAAALAAIANGGALPYPDLLTAPDLMHETADFSAAMRALADGSIVRVDALVAAGDAGTAEDHPEAVQALAPGVAVAILGSSALPVEQVDPGSLRLGPGLARAEGAVHYADADMDGNPDLVVRFSRADSGIGCAAGVVTLIGSTFDGRAIGALAYVAGGSCGD